MILGENSDKLFTALAEQLKTPLLQIARLSEAPAKATLPKISVISEHALRLVDAYSQAASQAQAKLLFEPINSGSVLYDVAHTLSAFAQQNNYELRVETRAKSLPIMAHRATLNSILTMLGTSLIEASIDQENTDRYILMGTHRSAKGTIVGAFSSQINLSQKALILTRQLHGRAPQAAPLLGQAGAAGLVIADKLSEQLSAPLRAYRHGSLSGIGSLLQPSRQLQLVV